MSDLPQRESQPTTATTSEPPQAPGLDRRQFLHSAGGVLALTGLAPLAAQSAEQGKPGAKNYVSLPPIQNVKTEGEEKAPGPFEPVDKRVGFAIVGLGRLSLDQILPAFGKTKFCKPVALVSGDSEKAGKVAAQYGIRPSAIYTYDTFEGLAHNPDVKVIYIVLPNSMHMEFTLRAAKIGKHVLCEKPMANSIADCQKMISACQAADVKLMIAYRQQYEPMNREVVKMVRAGDLGKIRSFVATLTQNQEDPSQWRLHKNLAGGGCLPDVGIYCLSAARFWSGEEPIEVFGQTVRPKDDPRFKEVESSCNFTLRFPSGFIATCNSGYAAHRSSFGRIEGSDGWAQLSPSFGYNGLKLYYNKLLNEHATDFQPAIAEMDQFALEMDHMASCVAIGRKPHTPGEEGMRDIQIIEAIYESAHSNRPVALPQPSSATRGQEPEDPS